MKITDNPVSGLTWIRIASEELFKVSIFAAVIIGAAEWLQEGLVSAYFNMNLLLVIMTVSGIVWVVMSKD